MIRACVLLISIYIGIIVLVQGEEKNLKGPYKTTARLISKCSTTSLPLMSKNPGFVYNLRLVNTTNNINLLVGNLTALRNVKNISILMTSHRWEQGGWKVLKSLPALTCKSPACVTVIAMMTNIKFDSTECIILKGAYNLEMDVNVIDHIWEPEQQYGIKMWKLELRNKWNTLFCIYLETTIEPI